MKTKPDIHWLIGLMLAAMALAGRGEIRLQPQPDHAPPTERGAIVVPKPTVGSEPGAGASNVPGAGDALQFLNGDILHGKLISIDAQNGVRWRHADAKQAVDFAITNLARIKLEARKSAAATASTNVNAVARLTNDDEMCGVLLSLDDEKLDLQTWYAGKVSIRRKMVHTITPSQGSASVIYEGPTGLEGWKAGQGQAKWRYHNGAFITTRQATLGRDLKLPDMSSIEFDLAWSGYLQLAVCIYTDSLEQFGYNSNSYMLALNPGQISLQRVKRTGGSTPVGHVQVQSMNQKNKMRFAIRTNKEKASIALFIDGVMVQNWKDPTGFAGMGTGVLFFSQQNGLIKLSNLRVAEWDGKLEEPSGALAKTKEDTVRLVNNDKVSGSLQTIRDGVLAFTTSFATMTIPFQRVAQIQMAGEKIEQAKRNAGDVRAFFTQRGSVTFQLEQWDDQQVTGSSQNFGKLKFVPEAFQMIQFNLDRTTKTATEDAGNAVMEEGDEDVGDGVE